MNRDRDFLINRLIHKAKNGLSTLKLAATNLKIVLDDSGLPSDQRNQAEEFFQVIHSQINEIIQSLSRALLLTHDSTQNPKSVNLGQLLLELTHKHPQLKLKDQASSLVVQSEPNLLKWFLESFFNLLTTNQNQAQIEIKPESNQIILILNSETTSNNFLALLDSENTQDSLELLTIRQLAIQLGIKFLQSTADNGEPILIIQF